MSDGSEFVCKKCNGTGRHPSHARRGRNSRKKCYECGGSGKLDWIENIVGKKKLRSLAAEWSMSHSSGVKHLYDSDLEKEIKNMLAEEIVKRVDEDIMKYLGIPEKVLKPPDEPETVVINIKKVKMGG